jgi:DNA-binding response OmpR family regulator
VLEERATEAVLREIPVIIVSANRDPEVSAVLDQGVCAFLPKPFDIGALSALVRACLVARPPAV